MFGKLALVIPLVLLLLLFSSVYAGESAGLASGNLTTADACGFGLGYIGGFIGFGDKAVAIFGTINYGFSDYTEGRVKFGFSDLDSPKSDPQLLLGFDFKYEVMDYYDRMVSYPFDLALGGFVEYVSYDPRSVLAIGGNLIGSIPYKFESGRRLTPYSRLNFRLERYSYESSKKDSESDFRVGLNIGTKFELSGDMNLYGELQIDGNTGLFAGLEVRVF